MCSLLVLSNQMSFLSLQNCCLWTRVFPNPKTRVTQPFCQPWNTGLSPRETWVCTARNWSVYTCKTAWLLRNVVHLILWNVCSLHSAVAMNSEIDTTVPILLQVTGPAYLPYFQSFSYVTQCTFKYSSIQVNIARSKWDVRTW